jgi:L-alanine-DL-glutamate epimerase-like enolase superfamily enzyme
LNCSNSKARINDSVVERAVFIPGTKVSNYFGLLIGDEIADDDGIEGDEVINYFEGAKEAANKIHQGKGETTRKKENKEDPIETGDIGSMDVPTSQKIALLQARVDEQMAIFDAVGKLLETPAWALMGIKRRSHAHVGWWAIDMPVEDWILECEEAEANGYTTFKTKARPWFDLEDQVRRLSEAIPDYFLIDMDFNDFGADTSIAKSLCKRLEKYEKVAIWESPIAQEDVEGNRHLRSHLAVPIAHHTDRPAFRTQLMQDICDGFVMDGELPMPTRRAASARNSTSRSGCSGWARTWRRTTACTCRRLSPMPAGLRFTVTTCTRSSMFPSPGWSPTAWWRFPIGQELV